MRTIAKFFGKSPFSALQTHMDKVASCIDALQLLFSALDRADSQEITKAAKQISQLEYEADLTKNDIRNHLPTSLFLPIDRAGFLEILSLQDRLADQAEDIGILLTLSDKPLGQYEKFQKDFQNFRQKNLDSFSLVYQVVKQLQEVLEASFGGVEAQKLKKMIENIAYQEHEVDIMQHALLKKLFASADELSNTSFYLWRNLFKEVASLSNLSEKLGNRIRMILE